MPFMSTHPDTKERILLLKNKLNKEEEYQSLGLDYNDFKEAVLQELN